MAKVVDLGDLDKISKSVDTAMKLDAKKAKQREEQRKKSLSDLEGFKKNYAERQKELKADDKRIVDLLEKAVGIAEHELPKGHPLVADLNTLIDQNKKVPRDTHYEEMDKAIDALDDWDTSLEKLDLPKQAIASLKKTKEVLASAHSDLEKVTAVYEKALSQAVKDLETVEDPDVKKRLKAIFDTQRK
jgi:hypothetical protein